MSISTQLPQFVTATRAGALQSLGLQAGQVLDARILGPAPHGGTQVEIRGQMLNLMLPASVGAGETIRLEVQGVASQLRLALLPAATPPARPATAAPPNMPPPPQAAPLPPQAAPLPPVIGAMPAPAPGGSAQPVNAAATTPLPATSVAPAAAPVPGQPAPAGAGSFPASPQPMPVPPAAPATAAPAPAQPGTPPSAAPMPPGTYPTAPPPNPLAAAAAATAAVPARPPAPAAVAGPVRPVVAPTITANATAHPPPGNAAPAPRPRAPQPATPQAALAQMVQVSGPRQGSITALTTALSAIAGRVVLPEPVARAAQQVLAGRVTIDAPRFDGAALQAAMRSSGVFQEANLTRGQPLLQPDMKSALLTLRQTLTTWLGQQAPVAAIAQIPPPLRGSIPRTRMVEAPPVDPDAAPEEVGKQLLQRTESALARVRLHQHASLPDPAGRSADFSMDLPVMVGAHQTLMQLQIHRDQHNESETAAERGWQMRFALSLPDMGEVGAQVTMRAGSIGVMLWATEPDASAALEAEIATLREALARADLRPGAVVVRHGGPPPPPAPPSGHFLDART